MIDLIKESANFIKSQIPEVPKIAITLGSGLGNFRNKIQELKVIPYEEIPGFKRTSVAGHSGELLFGKIDQTSVICLSGRYHAYEGYDQSQVVFPARVMKFLGVKYMLLTNAAGGINSDYNPGDLVLIHDHINMTGRNPLVGPNHEELGPRFPDMSNTYNKDFRELIKKCAENEKVKINKGTYVGVLGPTYETPAEIKMFKAIGGDLVGMSTVPEAIAAHHCGLIVAGISCVTNMAAGLKDEVLAHDDVKEQAQKATEKFSTLVESICKSL